MHERVVVTVVDPWDFADENGGHSSFTGCIVGCAAGCWLLQLSSPVTMNGESWRYAIPTTRHGQHYFNDPLETDRSANVVFLSDEDARSSEFLEHFNPEAPTVRPWVIGNAELDR